MKLANENEEEYSLWKSCTPYLYDLVVSSGLPWPSLTIQWFPEYQVMTDCTVHRVLMGTHTSPQTDGVEEQNHLLITEVILPNQREPLDVSKYTDDTVSGGMLANPLPAKVEIEYMINHPAEVNRARFMPQNQSIIATKTIYSDVLIFDKDKHPLKPNDNLTKPEMILTGHSAEGFGISWNTMQEGYLVSSSNDHTLCFWDIGRQSAPPSSESTTFSKGVQPAQMIFEGHTDVVSDVEWHPKHLSYFASVGDDKKLLMWDLRSQSPALTKGAHNDAVNALSFSPFSEWLLVTGSNDKTVKVWDLRKMKTSLVALKDHAEKVNGVQWSPSNETVLASYSDDRRLNIWDLSLIGDKRHLRTEDEKDGPPELIFIHAGHTDVISDFAWCPTVDWLCASVSQDNVLQIWKVGEHIYNDSTIAVDDGKK